MKRFASSFHAGPQINLLIGESENMEGIDMNTLTEHPETIYGVKIQNKLIMVYWRWRRGTKNKKAGSFRNEGRYYFALSDFYSTKKDYFPVRSSWKQLL